MKSLSLKVIFDEDGQPTQLPTHTRPTVLQVDHRSCVIPEVPWKMRGQQCQESYLRGYGIALEMVAQVVEWLALLLESLYYLSSTSFLRTSTRASD